MEEGNGKAQCLVGKCLLEQAETMGHSEEFSMADYAGFLCVYAPHSYDSDSMVIASFTD